MRLYAVRLVPLPAAAPDASVWVLFLDVSSAEEAGLDRKTKQETPDVD
jgi:hypothetical protein